MDRMEILKLALASSPDAGKALELAKQMAEFVAGNKVAEALPAPKPAQASLELTQVAPRPKEQKGRLSLIAPGVMGRKLYLPAEAHGRQHLSRHARAWSDEERIKAAAMLDHGATFVEVAQALERTSGAIEKGWRFGLFPTKIQHQILPRAAK